MAPRFEPLTFPGFAGDDLSARLDLPVGPTRAVALFAHCFTCSKDLPAASRLSKRLAARGFAVLRFDFTGLGSSDGDFANTTFSSNVEDLVRAAALDQGCEKAVLLEHSGGLAVDPDVAQGDAARHDRKGDVAAGEDLDLEAPGPQQGGLV